MTTCPVILAHISVNTNILNLIKVVFFREVCANMRTWLKNIHTMRQATGRKEPKTSADKSSEKSETKHNSMSIVYAANIHWANISTRHFHIKKNIYINTYIGNNNSVFFLKQKKAT